MKDGEMGFCELQESGCEFTDCSLFIPLTVTDVMLCFVVAPPKPTWAAMASKNTTAPPAAAAAAASAVTGYSPKPQVAKPDVVKTEGTPATTGLSQRTPRY